MIQFILILGSLIFSNPISPNLNVSHQADPTLTTSSLTTSHHQDPYKFYLWKTDGAFIKSKTDTNSKNLEYLNFGSEMILISKTDKSATTEIISAYLSNPDKVRTKKTKSLWYKVKTEKGSIGFINGQYLLNIKPKQDFNSDKFNLPLKELYSEVLFDHRPKAHENSEINYKVVKQWDYNITETFHASPIYIFSVFEFHGYTLEEAYLLSSTLIQKNSFAELQFDFQSYDNKIVLSIQKDKLNLEQ